MEMWGNYIETEDQQALNKNAENEQPKRKPITKIKPMKTIQIEYKKLEKRLF